MLESNQESRNYKRKKNIKSDDTKMLSINRVADKYGFSLHTVYNWINRDGLKHIRHGPGGKIVIKQSDVEAFIEKWYGYAEKKGIIGMVVPCSWLGCNEFSSIDATVKDLPDNLPEGWKRLVISNSRLADKVMPTAEFDCWLCPKHYQELVSLLNKSELNVEDKSTAQEK